MSFQSLHQMEEITLKIHKKRMKIVSNPAKQSKHRSYIFFHHKKQQLYNCVKTQEIKKEGLHQDTLLIIVARNNWTISL